METVTIKGEIRDTSVKKSGVSARKNGLIPAVMYGGEKNYHFSTTASEVKNIVYTPSFKLAEIQLNGEIFRAILKDIQFHPVTDEILHIDFLKLQEGEPVKVEVPIHFTGESPGVRNGGTLIQSLRKVMIKAAPEHLVDQLAADLSEVKLNDSIRIRDLVVGDEIEILSPGNTPIAAVLTPRALKDAALLPEDMIEEEEELAKGEEAGEAAEGEEGGEEDGTAEES